MNMFSKAVAKVKAKASVKPGVAIGAPVPVPTAKPTPKLSSGSPFAKGVGPLKPKAPAAEPTARVPFTAGRAAQMAGKAPPAGPARSPMSGSIKK